MPEFDGRTILITGGGTGIGLATARRLVDAGANVVLAARRTDTIDAAAKELDPSGDRVLAVATDVSVVAELDELVDRIRISFGRLDGVFANAGVAFSSRIETVTENDFDRIVGVNFKGTFFTIQKAVPLFDTGGSVVINGTCLTHRGNGFASVYAATKAAVTNLTRTLASDLAGRNIRVNAVSPGFVPTDLLDTVVPTEAHEAIRSGVPLGRLGRPEDVADAVTFLLSPRAAYITGQDLGVDGGLTHSDPV
ncbi:SDR family NAD(P)-dependent oxidoreductase [Actinophytocola oryzae]|uniref:NAD(P)-dependent dehydrogenase (Short-subunit alcohol dehydrogenase family) n=1 Tax=Actinophytocola oryzae TaxID=502181 RepID=A0A4R7UY94_9PSEU|nr:glucose 1-dehydrogenase [Actinophytocola oryzae]TDV41052.1 NAD(P)-dependent dehydrogenase (short-subunit alcohol dehydrogenase family) [Actinophytocola oryzae]